MKYMSRTLSLMLMCALILTGCGQSGTPSETTAAGDSAASDVTTDPNAPAVEPCDYGGKEFSIFASDSVQYDNYYFAEEQTGEAMNDAIFKRRMQVEDYLGVTLTQRLSEKNVLDFYGEVREFVMAGDDAHQLILAHQFHGNSPMLGDGLLYDWNKLPSIDLDKPYWNQLCNSNLELDGKLYFAVSDYMLSESVAILFNKDLIEQFKMDDPYTLVRDGKWTLARLLSMASQATADLNGDTVMDMNDRYGVSGESGWRLNGFMYAGDVFLTEKDASGAMTLTINNERTVKLMESLDRLINGSDDLFTWKINAKDQLKMDSGRVLFQFEGTAELKNYRDTNVDFGLLPYPKLDDAQKQYYSMEWSGLMALPKTIGDPEMVGKVMEMLSYYSGDTTQPAYFDIVLGEKLSRDAESKEMLSYIFDNVVVDPGMNYFAAGTGMNQLFYTLFYGLQNGSATFASYYAQYEEKAHAEIESLMETIRSLD